MLYGVWNVHIEFDLQLRDLFLLFFFSTVGLGAKFRVLRAGGGTMVLLVAVAAVLLILQNTAGVSLAMLLGGHPGYGLLGGSISFAGGHGTAIAWGQVASEAGLERAEEFAIANATFGLIAGGLIGGPVAGWLIKRYRLRPSGEAPASAPQREAEAAPHIDDMLGTLLVLAICVTAGDLVNRFLSERGFGLPGFLTAMMVGIFITNLSDMLGASLSRGAISAAGEISLQLFLAMSLMSMQLWSLIEAAGPVLIAVLTQSLLMTFVAVFLVFRFTGRNYDSAVIAAGFCGLGLGATPVAIANIAAVTGKYGPSPKAMLVIPLVGAFFIDLMNAVVIKLFLSLPFFSVS